MGRYIGKNGYLGKMGKHTKKFDSFMRKWGFTFLKMLVFMLDISICILGQNIILGITFLPTVKDIIDELNYISLNAGLFYFSRYGWCFIYYDMSLQYRM